MFIIWCVNLFNSTNTLIFQLGFVNNWVTEATVSCFSSHFVEVKSIIKFIAFHCCNCLAGKIDLFISGFVITINSVNITVADFSFVLVWSRLLFFNFHGLSCDHRSWACWKSTCLSTDWMLLFFSPVEIFDVVTWARYVLLKFRIRLKETLFFLFAY